MVGKKLLEALSERDILIRKSLSHFETLCSQSPTTISPAEQSILSTLTNFTGYLPKVLAPAEYFPQFSCTAQDLQARLGSPMDLDTLLAARSLTYSTIFFSCLSKKYHADYKKIQNFCFYHIDQRDEEFDALIKEFAQKENHHFKYYFFDLLSHQKSATLFRQPTFFERLLGMSAEPKDPFLPWLSDLKKIVQTGLKASGTNCDKFRLPALEDMIDLHGKLENYVLKHLIYQGAGLLLMDMAPHNRRALSCFIQVPLALPANIHTSRHIEKLECRQLIQFLSRAPEKPYNIKLIIFKEMLRKMTLNKYNRDFEFIDYAEKEGHRKQYLEYDAAEDYLNLVFRHRTWETYAPYLLRYLSSIKTKEQLQSYWAIPYNDGSLKGGYFIL